MYTIGMALMWATKGLMNAGIDTPSLDADLLLSEATGFSREDLFFHPEIVIDEDKYFLFEKLVARRKNREPIAYITGKKEFFGISFDVNPAVLIPRPETEEIVEKSLEYIRNCQKKKIYILDLGTGSGAIAIALVKTLKDWEQKYGFDISKINVSASDYSQEALNVALENAKATKVDGLINFVKSNLIKNIENINEIDLILTNLPYLALDGRCEYDEEIKYEPGTALYAGSDGLDRYRDFFSQLIKNNIKPEKIILECSSDQVEEIKKYNFNIDFVEV